jgi:hypothetical protein
VQKEFDKGRASIIKDIQKEREQEERRRQEEEAKRAELERIRLEKEQKANRPKVLLMREKKAQEMENIMGDAILTKKKASKTTYADRIECWVDRIEKKLDARAAIDKAAAVNHLEHQKELSETL